MEKLTEEIIVETKTAIKMFGSYTFHDKGPHEVMEIPAIVNKLQALTPEMAAKVLRELCSYNKKNRYGESVARTCVLENERTEQNPNVFSLQKMP